MTSNEPVTPRHRPIPPNPPHSIFQATVSPLPPSSPLSDIPSSSPFCNPSPSHSLLITPRPRASSLPPLSSDDLALLLSSPIVGNASQRAATARKKGHRKRLATLETKHQTALLERLEQARTEQDAIQDAEDQKASYFSSILEGLHVRGYSLGQLILYVSDPVFKQGIARWESLFRDNSVVPRILNLWAFKSSVKSREQVHDWAVAYVADQARREAQQITSSRFLSTFWRPIDSKLILGFQMSSVYSCLQRKAPIFMQVFQSVATSARQLKEMTSARLAKKTMVCIVDFQGYYIYLMSIDGRLLHPLH